MRTAVAAFLGGFITLSLELLGFRALAPYFGYSIYVFGSLIGVVLLAMAGGYVLGGRLGDSIGTGRFAWLPLFGSIYIGIGAATYTFILPQFQYLPLMIGALLSALVLFAIPMIFFAAIAPYAVARLAEQGLTAAMASARISFWGTLGSLGGTFLTAFLLLPLLGTHKVFFLNAALGLLVAAIFRFRAALWGLPPVLLLMFLPVSYDKRVLHAEDSAYAHLEVVDYGRFLGLRTERRSESVYSIIPKSGKWDFAENLYNLFAVPPLLTDGKEVLLMGLGAGTLPLIHETANPEIEITGVDIDPAIIEIGKKYFQLDDRKNLKSVLIEDVRPFLSRTSDSYDILEIDLFRGGTEIPFYLVTKEFFELARSRIREGGILAMNIYDPSENLALRDSILSSMAESFPHIYVVPAGQGSFFAVGSLKDLPKLDGGKIEDTRLRNIYKTFTENKFKFNARPDLVLTDDKAPLERFYGSPL